LVAGVRLVAAEGGRSPTGAAVRLAWARNRRCKSSEDPDGGNLTLKRQGRRPGAPGCRTRERTEMSANKCGPARGGLVEV